MYKTPFYITKNHGNNALSFDKRQNKKLYVPSIIDGKQEDIKLGNEIVFEDYGFDDKLSSCKGLNNFYRIKWKDKEIILFDNHNHALYFWYEARKNGLIGDNNTLVHIDEHSDMRDTNKYLMKPESLDLKNIFEYTNFHLNVGNYIIPAKKEGIIDEIIQIRNETNLLDNRDKIINNDMILNLDLDFFCPNLDFIDYKLKKEVTLNFAKQAKVITVATSPFFINQTLAIKVFKDLFGE